MPKTPTEITDYSVLAPFSNWAMSDHQAANQAFNITNGDTFRWSRLWPRQAGYFGLQPDRLRAAKPHRWMADRTPVWRPTVERYGLLYSDVADVALWPFEDFV